jgi:predicted Zn-dependent protease
MTVQRLATVDAATTAERLLDLVGRKATGAEAEVTVRTGTDALTRFANGFIHQNVAEDVSHVLLRIALDGRVASSSLDARTDDETLSRLVDNVVEAARIRSVDPGWPGVASSGAPAPAVDHWADATAAATPDVRAAIVADFVAAAGGLETAGSCRTTAVEVAFASTGGQRLTGRSTTSAIDGIARTPTADGSGREAGVDVSTIDGRAAGELAAGKARTASDPGDLEPGRYEVVLEPQCVANVLQFLFVYGFNGRPLEEGRSFARIGEQQFDPAVTIRDDATDGQQAGIAFDVEGTPRRRVDVVVDGVTRSVLHTRRTAARAGVESTGHAEEAAEEWGALPSNTVLVPGSLSRDQLIGQVGRGLLVTDFWYTRILDPRTQVVTGLTRNGVWLIEDGRVVRPVRNLRFTQSYVEALGAGAVLGVGSDRALAVSDFGGHSLTPSLHLASWNFTGGARG